MRTDGPRNAPPGRVPGAALGLAAGLLLAAVWAYGAWDVSLALSTVFAGLVLAVVLGAPAWRPFGLAMLAAAAATDGVIALIVV